MVRRAAEELGAEDVIEDAIGVEELGRLYQVYRVRLHNDTSLGDLERRCDVLKVAALAAEMLVADAAEESGYVTGGDS